MYDLEPNKSLGQHWLFDETILSKITEYAELSSGDVVMEVGPGKGTLTKFLLETGANVEAVEYDANLYSYLRDSSQKLFGDRSSALNLVNKDILDYRFDQIEKPFKVVANIPYYLTSKLIRNFTELETLPEIVVLLIQKEVAQRVCADPGDMSLLSVWSQMYFDCTLGVVVEPQMFSPPPKVDSQVVIMKKLATPLCNGYDLKKLNRVLKAGFSNKRKILHNSLSAGLGVSKDQVKILLDNVKILPSARPQELTINDWLRLSKQI